MAIDITLEKHGSEITKTGRCSVSGKEYRVTVLSSQWERWQEGMKIQQAMPDLDADQREFLISGSTPEEWARLFPPDEDD